MNGLDIILIIPLIWGAYNGFKKGFIAELAVSVLMLLSLMKGIKLFHQLLPIVHQKLSILGSCLPVVLAILIVCIGGAIVYLVKKSIKNILDITFLGIFDNIIGAFFGLCKSALLISLLLYCWHSAAIDSIDVNTYIKSSTLYPLLANIVPKILHFKLLEF